jgi:hypothetical protein
MDNRNNQDDGLTSASMKPCFLAVRVLTIGRLFSTTTLGGQAAADKEAAVAQLALQLLLCRASDTRPSLGAELHRHVHVPGSGKDSLKHV